MKRNQWKIGQQQHKAFPVAYARFSLAEDGHRCNICEQPALFGLSFYNIPLEEIGNLQQIFSRKEAQEIVWERAYRAQKSGSADDESPRFPICVPCALQHIAMFLGKPESECVYLIVGATTTGKSILLFDRNLRRDMTHPSAAVGFFESLDDFRQQYWQEVQA